MNDRSRPAAASAPQAAPPRRARAAALVAGGTVVTLLMLFIGIALTGWLADSGLGQADRLEKRLGHLIVVTGNLVGVDSALLSHTGVYLIRVPRSNGLGDVPRELKGPHDWAFSAPEATLPSTYDFLVDVRGGKAVVSGPAGSLTIPDQSTTDRLRTNGITFSMLRARQLIAASVALPTATWWITQLLRRPQPPAPRRPSAVASDP